MPHASVVTLVVVNANDVTPGWSLFARNIAVTIPETLNWSTSVHPDGTVQVPNADASIPMATMPKSLAVVEGTVNVIVLVLPVAVAVVVWWGVVVQPGIRPPPRNARWELRE